MPDVFDVASHDLSQLTDDELLHLAADVAVEQHRRALASADTKALIEDGFVQGFTQGGDAMNPWLADGMLVCPGALTQKGSNPKNHECTFVSVKLPGAETGQWCFEATDVIDDEIRYLEGTGKRQRSITVVVACEGLEVDVVVSKCRNGKHEMQQVRSMKVERGELVHVSTRDRQPKRFDHR